MYFFFQIACIQNINTEEIFTEVEFFKFDLKKTNHLLSLDLNTSRLQTRANEYYY